MLGANVGNNEGAEVFDPRTGKPIPNTTVPFGTYGWVGDQVSGGELGRPDNPHAIYVEFTPDSGITVLVDKADLILEEDYIQNDEAA